MAEGVEDWCRHLSGRWQIRWDWWVENVWEPVPSDSWVWKSSHPECMQLGQLEDAGIPKSCPRELCFLLDLFHYRNFQTCMKVKE